jgi:hypothetical protein
MALDLSHPAVLQMLLESPQECGVVLEPLGTDHPVALLRRNLRRTRNAEAADDFDRWRYSAVVDRVMAAVGATAYLLPDEERGLRRALQKWARDNSPALAFVPPPPQPGVLK